MKKLAGLFALLSIAVASCYYDNLSELHPPGSGGGCDTTGTITYNNQVSELFSNSCGTNGTCHTATTQDGNVVLDSYASAIQVNDAKLIAAIEHTNSPDKYMPVGGMLSQSCINVIKKWIATGKLQ